MTRRNPTLTPEDFPDSPYAQELRRGVTTRGFAPGIEAEYREEHLDRVRLRMRIWFTLMGPLSIQFAILTARASGLWTAYGFVHLLVVIPCAIALVAILWSRWYEPLFDPVVRPLTILMLAVLVDMVARTIAVGQTEMIAALVLYTFAVYFLLGFLFLSAMTASLATMATFLLAAWLHGVPIGLMTSGLVMMVTTAGVAAIVCRDIELSYRRNFLESVLIRDLAARDGLTGVMNRRAFDEHLRRVWQQALRDRRQIALLMIDIDHFKAYNDHHGHQAGDSTLRQVAQTIQGFARRPLDLAARYGGEEFGVILYDVSITQLSAIAEQIRAAVEKLHIAHGARGADAAVTISTGVGAIEPALNRSLEGAVQFADEALYAAKQNGRNCVVIRGGDEYHELQTGTFSNLQHKRLSA